MRSKTNGELRIENIGETVHLVGWCSKKKKSWRTYLYRFKRSKWYCSVSH